MYAHGHPVRYDQRSHPFGIPYSEVGGIHAHFEHVLISQFVLTQTQNDN